MPRFRVALQHPKLRWLVLCTAITTLTWLLAGCAGNPSLSAASTGFAPFILVVWLFVLSTVGLLTGCGGDNSASFPPNTFTGTTGSATATTTTTTTGTTTGSTVDVPVKLAVVSPPAFSGAGPQALVTIPDFKIGIEDANGNIVTSDDAPITISISNRPSGGRITGTTTVNAISGVATFSGLQLTLAGSYTVQATSPGLQATSVTFSVLPLPLGFKGHRDLAVVTGLGSSVVVADFDGDGHADVAVSGGESNPTVSVFFGNADGTFTLPVAVNSGISAGGHAGAGQMVVSNLNGDSALPDIFVGPALGAKIHLLAEPNTPKATTSGAIIVPSRSRTLQAYPQDLGVDAVALAGVAPGNFEGDGTSKDIVIATGLPYGKAYFADYHSDSAQVVVLHGTGSSIHLTPVVLSGGNGPSIAGTATSLAVGDFNGDGNLDIAVGAPYKDEKNYVDVFFGGGQNGGSVAAFTYAFFSLGSLKPLALAAGNLNGDAQSDLAVAGISQSGGSNNGYASKNIPLVTTLLGNHVPIEGLGANNLFKHGASQQFSKVVSSVATFASSANTTAAVIGQIPMLDDFFTLTNDGQGNLSSPLFFADGDTDDQAILDETSRRGVVPGSVFAVADLNGDGVPDVAAVNYSFYWGRNVNLFLNSSGTLQNAPTLQRTAYPTGGTLVDLNGDGKADLVWTEYSKGQTSLWVALSNGDGTFGEPRLAQSGLTHVSIDEGTQLLAGDFNGDGQTDVAVCSTDYPSDPVLVFPGNGDGTLGAGLPTTVSTSEGPLRFVAADLNGDGVLDLAIATDYGAYIAPGKGDGTFGAFQQVSTTDAADIAVTDFNGDGVPDIVTCSNSGAVVLLGSISNAAWTVAANQHSPVTSVGEINSLAVGDFDGDGVPDVVVSGYPESFSVSLEIATVLKGKSDGTLTQLGSHSVNGYPTQTFARDVNADGILDIVTANNDSNDVSILLGNGDGTFAPQQLWAVGDGETRGHVSLGDITGSGKVDIVSIDSEFDDHPGNKTITIVLHN